MARFHVIQQATSVNLKRPRFGFLSVVFVALLWICAGMGCATTRSDDESELPWNAPQVWESAPMLPGFNTGM